MSTWKVTVHLKSGKSHTNVEPMTDNFLLGVQQMFQEGKNGFIQIQVNEDSAHLFSIHEVSTLEIKKLT